MQILSFTKRATHADVAAIIMGRLGMSAKLISEKTGLTPAQIYGRLRMAGISVKDYRDGRTEFSQRVIAIAGDEAHHAIEDIKAQIRQLLPPATPPNETQNRQS